MHSLSFRSPHFQEMVRLCIIARTQNWWLDPLSLGCQQHRPSALYRCCFDYEIGAVERGSYLVLHALCTHSC